MVDKVGQSLHQGGQRAWKIVCRIESPAGDGNCLFITESDDNIPHYSFFLGWMRSPEDVTSSRFIRIKFDDSGENVKLGRTSQHIRRMLDEMDAWVLQRKQAAKAAFLARTAPTREAGLDAKIAGASKPRLKLLPPTVVQPVNSEREEELVLVRRGRLPKRTS